MKTFLRGDIKDETEMTDKKKVLGKNRLGRGSQL